MLVQIFIAFIYKSKPPVPEKISKHPSNPLKTTNFVIEIMETAFGFP